MKKYLLFYKILFLGLPAFAQLTISPGVQWVNKGNISININNLDLVNNGTVSPGNSIVKFTGNTTNQIGGSSVMPFYQLEILKSDSNKIILLTNINVDSLVNFSSGFLDLNQKNLTLGSNAFLNNESENSRIIAPNGGEAMITLDMNAPSALNAGNLGAYITSAVNLGIVTVKRGQLSQSGTGLSGSISRYFTIIPQINTSLNAELKFTYFDAEKNGRDESNFALFQSDDNGNSWTNKSQSSINSLLNYVERSGLSSLSKFTLSDTISVSGCSATGVVLSLKAGKQNTVNVNWSTATETNNQGFAVERKLKGETDFTGLGFVNSKAPGGNSATQLNYTYSDITSFNDTSYYRLKIVGLNSSTCYSDTKILVPKGGGKKGPGGKNVITYPDTLQTVASSKTIMPGNNGGDPKITLGPNPNNGNFWFMVTGINKETIAALYTVDGKLLKQFRVSNLQKQQVYGLRNGFYILKVNELPAFRIIVQNEGNPINNFPAINTSTIKNQ